MFGSHWKKISREIKAAIKGGMKCKGRVFDTYFGFLTSAFIRMWLNLELGVGDRTVRAQTLIPTSSYSAPIFTLTLNSVCYNLN